MATTDITKSVITVKALDKDDFLITTGNKVIINQKHQAGVKEMFFKDGSLHVILNTDKEFIVPIPDVHVTKLNLAGSVITIEQNDTAPLSIDIKDIIHNLTVDTFLKDVTYDEAKKHLIFHIGTNKDGSEKKIEVSVADFYSSKVGNGIDGDGSESKPLTVKLRPSGKTEAEKNLINIDGSGIYVTKGSTYETNTDKTTIAGSGTLESPISVKVHKDSSNLVQPTPDGVLVKPAIDMHSLKGTGTSSEPLTVKLSTKSDNAISLNDDGLYVNPTKLSIEIDKKTIIGSATKESPLQVAVSKTENNSLTLIADGLYVKPSKEVPDGFAPATLEFLNGSKMVVIAKIK